MNEWSVGRLDGPIIKQTYSGLKDMKKIDVIILVVGGIINRWY